MALLDTVFHYFRGLQRSRAIFTMRSRPHAITLSGLLLVYEFSHDYVIIWRVRI